MNLTSDDQKRSYLKRHNELMQLGAKLPLCEGFYRITAIQTVKKVGNRHSVYATADWKPIGSTKTDTYYSLSLSLDPLYYFDSHGLKEENPANLEGKIIHVETVEAYNQEWNGEQTIAMKVKWSICQRKTPQITVLQEDMDQNDSFQKVADQDQINSIINTKPTFY